MTDAYLPPEPAAPKYGDPLTGPAGAGGTKRNGLGTTALVLGISSLVLFWVPVLGLVLGLVAVVLGVLGRTRVSRGQADNGGLAVAGLVTGIVGALLGAVVGVVLLLFADSIRDYANCVVDAGGNPTLERICEDRLRDDITG